MLPEKLPSILRYGVHIGDENRFYLELKGYCPVSYKEGQGPRDWSSIMEADPTILASYDGKYYGFSTYEKGSASWSALGNT